MTQVSGTPGEPVVQGQSSPITESKVPERVEHVAIAAGKGQPSEVRETTTAKILERPLQPEPQPPVGKMVQAAKTKKSQPLDIEKEWKKSTKELHPRQMVSALNTYFKTEKNYLPPTIKNSRQIISTVISLAQAPVALPPLKQLINDANSSNEETATAAKLVIAAHLLRLHPDVKENLEMKALILGGRWIVEQKGPNGEKITSSGFSWENLWLAAGFATITGIGILALPVIAALMIKKKVDEIQKNHKVEKWTKSEEVPSSVKTTAQLFKDNIGEIKTLSTMEDIYRSPTIKLPPFLIKAQKAFDPDIPFEGDRAATQRTALRFLDNVRARKEREERNGWEPTATNLFPKVHAFTTPPLKHNLKNNWFASREDYLAALESEKDRLDKCWKFMLKEEIDPGEKEKLKKAFTDAQNRYLNFWDKTDPKKLPEMMKYSEWARKFLAAAGTSDLSASLQELEAPGLFNAGRDLLFKLNAELPSPRKGGPSILILQQNLQKVHENLQTVHKLLLEKLAT